MALSRFSEAQAVFGPEMLRPVLTALLRESAGRVKVPGAIGGTLTAADIHIVDNTVRKVVPRMKWAAWRPRGTEQ